MENKLLVCPKCSQSFTIEDFKGHNSKVLDEILLNDRETIKKDYELRLAKEVANAEELGKNKSLIETNEIISELKKELQLKDQLIEIEKLKAISEEKQRQESIIKNLESKNFELTSNIESIKKSLDAEKQNLKNNLKLEFEKDFLLEKEKQMLVFQTERDELKSQIEELKLANEKNKIIQNKTKGENLEVEVETELRKTFANSDRVFKATENIQGSKPDFIQEVLNAKGEVIDRIIYEVKNAEWKQSWIEKLFTDTAKNKGKYGILIATSLNEKYKGVPYIRSDEHDNIWLTTPESFIFVSQIIRILILFEEKQKAKIREYEANMASAKDEEYNKLVESYNAKNKQIEDFWSHDVQKAFSTCRKELENLALVSSSLIKSSEKIDKSKERIAKELTSSIYNGLERILGKIDEVDDYEESN